MQDFYGLFNNSNALLKLFSMIILTTLSIIIAKKIFFKLGFVDKPNYRSNHKTPIALGGGIIIIPLIVFYSFLNNYVWNLNILLSISILFFISIWDDVKNIRPLPRLFFHFFAMTIYVFLYLCPQVEENLIYNKNLLLFFGVLLIFGLVWFINAFNFMDGINGITSIQAISICLSLIVLDYLINKELNILGFSILIPILIFCYFNWTPSSIFLGDAGSITLGFIMIFLLIEFSLKGMWVSSVILPLYYLMDTGITLTKRVYKRQRFWEAHRDHFYQQAVKNGFSHTYICLKLFLINLGLFFLSFCSYIYKNNISFFFIAIFWCSFFLYMFSQKKK